MRAITILHHKYSWMDAHKEISDLSVAAGFTEVASLSFKKVHTQHYLPELKIEELRNLIEQHRADVIVFNESLSAKELQKLDELLSVSNVKLIDKIMLILEIFSRKANSKDIQLQIKLAELQYVQPRLRQVIGDSINTDKQARDRGTGETLKNIMKTDFRTRISHLEKQLKDFKTEAPHTSQIMTLPILGFYSVGKTSLFNMLTESHRETNPEAFTTMFLKSTWSKLMGFPIEIIDTIGLVELPTSIVESFTVMLEKVFASRYIIICIDAAMPNDESNEQLEALNNYYEKFSNSEYSYSLLFAFTKCDKITSEKYIEKTQLLMKAISKGMFQCDEYQIMGSRSDKPVLVQHSFIKKMSILLKKDLFEFTLQDLSPSMLSKVHDSSKVTKEIWNANKATITGQIPIQMFSDNLGDLSNNLTEESRKQFRYLTPGKKTVEITDIVS